ncbi:ATPase family AAA domain-containing protein FIGL1 isoform X3 [Ziziphus jujuba]|uniref:ATPase family AAA domain-containing protein FIGL1 isoform X3 n=1 Tax=Ziziphus jujuba TaxID=326968 RepID=A0ABM3ZSE3_ZIZJJ|nr:ATPase family AAA domain-containing protein FIGL1 isoform X3 [Ziziphus jujuba]
MAGKEEGIRSSSATAMVEEEEEVCWRKQVDDNLKRLQSLLFGAELALENRDFSSAQLLGLRLIGFLDSHSHSDLDHAFIRPIRRQALSMLDSARRSLSPASDIKAFERAKQVPGCVFGSRGDIEIEKIKKSKYLQALLQQSNEVAVNGLGDKLEKEDKLNKRPLPFHNQNKGQSSFPFQRIEEDRAYGNSSGPKRLHMEINSPKTKSPLSDEDANTDNSGNGFVTAKAKMEMDARQRRGLSGSPSANVSPQSDINAASRGYNGRSYGVPRRGVRGNFIPPIRSNGGNTGNVTSRIAGKSDDALEDSTKRCLDMLCGPDGELPEKLRNLEPRLIEHVSNEIMDKDPNVRWNDIAGLEHAKKCVTEMVIWPLLRPDIFKGCRSPGKGLLLFGPPGTGKTMIGKAIAGEAKATFFYISASSLTSKWIGEGEKLVRALFGVASCRQPAVIFVDEIDSLLSQRKSEGEHESSRRLKTQFLIEMEGFDSGNEQILLIGATNRPQELDEAARRRLTKRLYIPLPSSEARAWIIQNLLEKDGLFKLAKEEIDKICNLTEGYSGSDMKNLVKDASMGPLREALKQGIEITTLKKEDMRPVTLQDFVYALQEVRPSVSLNELGTYEEWNRQFGSLSL